MNRNIELGCDVIAQLMAGRTQPEIADATGRRCETVARYLRVMRDKGLVYVREWRTRPGVVPTAVYALQPGPRVFQDAPKPAGKVCA